MKLKTAALVCLLLLVSSCLSGVALPSDLEECKPGSPAMFKFLGANAVNIKEGQTATFEGFCFAKNTATLKWLSTTKVEITIDSQDKRSALCTDEMIITSFMDLQFRTQFFTGASKSVFTLTYESDQQYVKNIGISIIPLCDKIRNLIPDLIATAGLFSADLMPFLPKWALRKLQNDNFRRLERLTGVKSVERNIKHNITYDWLARNVKSGDVYCAYSASGGSTAIIFGTGGVCSHVGMFLWEGTKLWFVETNPPSVHRYEASTYFNSIPKAGEDNFSILFLRDDLRSKFDVAKAWKTYYALEGSPYGFDNIIYSFWDTPKDSFTHLASVEILLTYVAILVRVPASKPLVSILIEQGLNNRLGTQGLNFEQIIEETARRGISIADLGAKPESPSYVYGTTQRGPRFICSAIVTKLLMDAGVLAGLNIVPQEMTPNDVYNMKLWKTTNLPVECVENDPYLPYCQITGHRALMPFRWFNSVTPYNHMNEKCPAIVPFLDRPDGC